MIIAVLSGITISLLRSRQRLIEEKDSYKSNTEALMSEVRRIQADSSTMALDIKTLTMSLDEYKRFRAEDEEKKKEEEAKIDRRNLGEGTSDKLLAKEKKIPYVPLYFNYLEGTTIDNGYIIFDSRGNEYVWIPVNDFYEMLGLSALDGGEYVGWNCDDGIYWIDFNHRKTVLDDGLEVYIIEMVWTPDTNWCDEEDFTME